MEVLQRALLLWCFAALSMSTVSRAQNEELNRRCQAQGTCADCIRESPDCVWCSDTSLVISDRRCNSRDFAPSCTIQDPKSELVSTSTDNFDGFNQVVPRRATVRVRPGSPEIFSVQVRPANNFPIDLYLLMDLSFSMSDDLANLKQLGTQLADRIQSISNNFTLGFGSFVDKRLASFVNIDPRRLRDPCLADCQSPYSFRHVISLTEDDREFSTRVNEQKISGNQDFPEGGFDGFLQAIVCTDVIGWRAVSRKILLYISDAGFHFAGDGLLGGVVKPNDGKCHMTDSTPNADGTIDYDKWDELDFPSIGQIAEKLDEFDIIPIFAVVRNFQDLYGFLRAELGNRAYLGTLASNSINVVNLVEDLYREISQRVLFTPENIPGISITVTPTDCSAGAIIGGVCSNVDIGDTVTFNMSVDVTECTEELIAGRKVEVRVVGFGTVVIDLTAICDCECDAQQMTNASECNNQGTLVCGICECNRGYFGDRCQCDNSGTQNGAIVTCPSGLNNMECSGRGTCTCGICECRTDANGRERFYGLACECDNTVCAQGIGSEICSGPTRGECTCDGCRCLPEPVTGMLYSRSDCSCTPNTQTCFDPSNQTDLCNGRGDCECGECVNCRAPYFGQLCELCSGDEICRPTTCATDGDNALCASCIVELLDNLNDNDVGYELFTSEGLTDALNGTLPAGSGLTVVMNDDMMVDAIELPENFSAQCSMDVNVTCPRMVIINETMVMEYLIQGELSTRCNYDLECIYRYYVATNMKGILLPIHVEYPPACPLRSTNRRSDSGINLPAWAIALIILGILFLMLLLGVILLILLKILLMILDYIEVRKFERELQMIKYTKNENPLYHSATKDYKNPIYGQ